MYKAHIGTENSFVHWACQLVLAKMAFDLDGSANMEICTCKQQCIMIPFILELVQHLRTYKCFVLTSLSNPGFELVETGICPDS